ncbi:sulfatase-like hydrolase/transferase [Paenibacillus radicis (ex Xue et al. 2023)]|uniref:Sulfatase-like hydrolase/transferase n=1 Tax=Paenibacillus radicis (ex Xue et al. 2023) TaxID=2972489 RepID=A0ABT1YG36_9BACL|nr:sulfatase-like hydrolase/transferase [Paenibacillus radicis (ex Xue et al. 2023)]MCR8632162.1 sulfatase-like hydrolase/transferase [Paenibacillus radicis (ex Xue et al. 2023)]
MKKKPHIILFNPDQWRGDVLGHMGNPAAITPHLDHIVANDAVSFQNAFCQNPVCTPSRCSFMSGWYPHVRGHRTMYNMMKPDEPVLLKTLKDEGYFVWWGGKNDLVPGENGFDAYCNVKYKPERSPKPMFGGDLRRGQPDSDTFYSFYVGKMENESDEELYYDSDWANVLGAIELIKNAPTDQPLCIYLPIIYPHPPYAVEDPWFNLIDRSLIPKRISPDMLSSDKSSMMSGLREKQHMQDWTEERWTELRATYYGMCSRVDHQFGMLMDALKEAGIYDDTAVFFFSDHGDFTGDYGLVEKAQNTFEDCLTRVPFIVKPPLHNKVKPRISEALVELVDLSATVHHYAGITPDYTHFGHSLAPLIAGERDEHRDAVFCEGGRLHDELHCNESAPANENTSMLYWPRGEMQRSEGPEHTKATMIRTKNFKYVRRFYETDELYDLNQDPGETQNKINDSSLAGELLLLKERMLDFYQETCDVVPHHRDSRGLQIS